MNTNKEKIDYIMKQCKDKDFKGINDWIDENILCKKANIEEIKVLICSIEAELNNAVFYSIVAITYAVVIGAVSLIPNEIKNGAFWILMASAIFLILYSVRRKKLIEQKTFLLKILYFKLEELNNKVKNDKKSDEGNGYREYVVRIKENENTDIASHRN